MIGVDSAGISETLDYVQKLVEGVDARYHTVLGESFRNCYCVTRWAFLMSESNLRRATAIHWIETGEVSNSGRCCNDIILRCCRQLTNRRVA